MLQLAVHPSDSKELNQGDILARVYHPQIKASSFASKESDQKFSYPFDSKDLKKDDLRKLRLVSPVVLLDLAMVISNSCDNYSGTHPVLLAPFRPYKFNLESDSDAKKWEDLRKSATGTGSPKLFYISGNTDLNIPRSDVVLSEIFSVGHRVLQQTMMDGNTKRIATLDKNSIVHLQSHLTLLFSRNPREDTHWASKEDLKYKCEWYKAQIARGSGFPDYERHITELEELKKHLEGTTISPSETP